MSWRTIIIANSAKLDYKMDCMVVRQKQITKIYLSEIYFSNRIYCRIYHGKFNGRINETQNQSNILR